MEQEKLYRDMDLRMKDVAERLLLTPISFRGWSMRTSRQFSKLREHLPGAGGHAVARRETGRSIITICFEVGFSSKTSFNVTFKKMTGLSPKEYREKNSV